jgi:outer membrane receptor protein involved in Fe transport
MKNIAFILLLGIAGRSIGQSQSIGGKLVDAGQHPIGFANVLLFSQQDTLHLLKGTLSDTLGQFRFESLPSGAYLINFRFIGYKPKSLRFENGKVSTLGTIQMEAEANLLNTVDIVARKEWVQNTAEGLVVKAEATLTQQGGTSIDLLRNIPTVFVDAEGGVTLRGKTPLILINGRNSSITNLASIPAASVERVEVITQPSARYDAQAENGILNIVLKKGSGEGTNGAFALGLGYGAAPRVNSSLLLNHTVTGSLGKWSLGLAYDNRFAKRARKATGDRTNFDLPSLYHLAQHRNDDRNEKTQNLRLNLGLESTKSVWELELIGSLEEEDNNETLYSTFSTQEQVFVSSNRRFSAEVPKENVAELALSYEHKFNQPDKKLTANLSSSYNSDLEKTSINTQSLAGSGENLNDPFLQSTRFNGLTNISTGRVDYATPLFKGIFSTGYKAVLQFFDQDFSQSALSSGIYVPNPQSSGHLAFNQQFNALYAQYHSYIGNKEAPILEYEIGLRAEQTHNNGKLTPLEGNNSSFSNDYVNLFPSGSLTWHLKDQEGPILKLSYGKRINRPFLGQLSPFTDITDSLTQRSGNPQLQPELIHTLELAYTQEVGKMSFTTKAYYRNGSATILPYTVLRSDGVLFTRPENVGTTQTYGLEGISSYQLSNWWNGNLSFSVFNQLINAGNLQVASVNQVLSWNAKWINEIKPWKGAKFQLISVYNAPTATIQGTRIAVYNTDLAFQQQVLGKKGRIGLIATDIFNTQKSGSVWNTSSFDFTRTFKVDTRAVLITFGYTFGTKFKEKLMENNFSNE